MAKYDSFKNADLQGLLKSRGLPTTGKKADLVARLTEDDAKKVAEETAKPAAATNDEDEIDWDDDEAAAPAAEQPAESAPAPAATEPAPAAEIVAKAGGEGQASNPQAVPNQIADTDPSTTDDLAVKAPIPASESTDAGAEPAEAAQEEEKKEEVPPPDYTKGLAATNLDEEIERRKKRAAKFGLKIEDDEGLKKLERMKKFGETGPPKGLDEALPERALKRGREGTDQGGRGGKRGRNDRNNDRNNNNGRRGGPRQNQGQGERRRDEREPRAKDHIRGNNGNAASWMSEADQKRAEERKKKWTTAA